MVFGFDQNVQCVFLFGAIIFFVVLQSSESSTNPNTRKAKKLALAELAQW